MLFVWSLAGSVPILVIEDEYDLAQIYSFALQIAGRIVEIQQNGLAAWQRLQQVVPAAVVLDLHLPGLDGPEIFRRMRQDGKLRDVPVVIVTADPPLAQEVFAEAQRLGAMPPAGIFSKPLELERLIQWGRGLG